MFYILIDDRYLLFRSFGFANSPINSRRSSGGPGSVVSSLGKNQPIIHHSFIHSIIGRASSIGSLAEDTASLASGWSNRNQPKSRANSLKRLFGRRKQEDEYIAEEESFNQFDGSITYRQNDYANASFQTSPCMIRSINHQSSINHSIATISMAHSIIQSTLPKSAFKHLNADILSEYRMERLGQLSI